MKFLLDSHAVHRSFGGTKSLMQEDVKRGVELTSVFAPTVPLLLLDMFLHSSV